MKEKKCGVYRMQSLVTGDFYIGSTVNLYRRYYDHRDRLKNNDHDNSKIRYHGILYGRDSFVFGVIEFCTKEQMYNLEQHYLDLFKPTYNKWLSVKTPKGYRPNPESIKKQMMNYKGIKDIESFRAKLKLAWIRRKQNPNFKEIMAKSSRIGSKHSDETKKLMSINRLGKKKSESMKEKMRLHRLGTKFDPINRTWIKTLGEYNGI